ncbi:MAG: glycosyltransferase [Leeuwenhoekiella sp.]
MKKFFYSMNATKGNYTKREINIAVLLTCHNRREKTVKCLEYLFNSDMPAGVKLHVFVVDDGSTDGTSKALREHFEGLHIIEGDGNLFWAGGMRKAWDVAAAHDKPFEFYLLLNDDTLIYKKTLKMLLEDYVQVAQEDAIIVGTTQDPDSKVISYGGSRLLKEYSVRCRFLLPNGKPQKVDLGNANIMLVPHAAYLQIGGLSKRYTHGIADYDYTLTAKKAGIPTFAASEFGGLCKDDHGNRWVDQSKSLKERLDYLFRPTGLSYKEYLMFIRLHFPFHVPWAFSKLWLKTFFPVLWSKFKNPANT